MAFAVVWTVFLAGDVAAELTKPDTSEPTPDPRMIEASSLLSDRASHDRAIELYREVLAGDPAHRMSRLWLARVLSWGGDYEESLAQYREIALRESDPPWAQKEAADVLTWSGRYEEAFLIYASLLERHPADFDLNLALARAYGWGGRTNEAMRAFRRTLQIRDDVSVRKELAKLSQAASKAAKTDSNRGQGLGIFLRDSDNLEIWREVAGTHYTLGDNSSVEAHLGYTRIGADPRVPGARDLFQAFDWDFALRRSLNPVFLARRLEIEVGLGARHWDHAKDQFVVRSRVEYSPSATTAFAASLEHGDFLDTSASLEAVRRGLSRTSLAASCWQSLGGANSVLGIFTATFVSDANEALSTYLSATTAPWSGHSLRLSLSANSISYTGRSDHYYDPVMDIGTMLSASVRYPETGGLYLRADVGIGFGYAKQDGVSGSGFTYRTELGTRLELRDWWFDLSGYRAESQRASVYTTHGAHARLGRSF